MTSDEGLKPEGAPERSRKAGVGAPSGVDGNGPKRFSVQRKMAIVARLLRGEPLDLVARQTNVSIARLTEWRDRALAGAATALKERERDDRDDEIARLKSKVGEITMDNELLNAKIAALAGKRPLAQHANSEVVGIRAARSANRFEALEPVRQGVHRCFGSIAPGVARGLMLRHDHGSNYMSGDFQDEIECLGIEASPSLVREPQGNGVAERFIRTLKENLLWARTFDTIEELRAALVEFARHYNETWLVARHGNRTPAQVRAAQSQLDRNAMADLKLAA